MVKKFRIAFLHGLTLQTFDKYIISIQCEQHSYCIIRFVGLTSPHGKFYEYDLKKLNILEEINTK